MDGCLLLPLARCVVVCAICRHKPPSFSSTHTHTPCVGERMEGQAGRRHKRVFSHPPKKKPSHPPNPTKSTLSIRYQYSSRAGEKFTHYKICAFLAVSVFHLEVRYRTKCINHGPQPCHTIDNIKEVTMTSLFAIFLSRRLSTIPGAYSPLKPWR